MRHNQDAGAILQHRHHTKCNFRMRRLHRYIRDPSYWRARANEMRATAAEVTDPKVKASAFGAADAYDKLAQLEKGSPASELPDATPHLVVDQERALLDGLRSVRDFAALENWNGNQPPQATTPMLATTGDGDHEMLGRLVYALEDQDQARRLPRATQLLPVRGPVDAPRAVPERVSIDLYNRMQTPMVWRPDRTLTGRTSFLVAGALIATGAASLVITIWPPEIDFSDAPISVTSKTRTAESEFSEQEPNFSEDKLNKTGIEERGAQARPATESTMKGDTSARPESNSLHQAPPSSSADAATEVREPTPLLIQEEKQSFAAAAHDSSCLPSASSVRKDDPTAWPSWTLRAPGHEGTKCWHAGTRVVAPRPQGDLASKRP